MKHLDRLREFWRESTRNKIITVCVTVVVLFLAWVILEKVLPLLLGVALIALLFFGENLVFNLRHSNPRHRFSALREVVRVNSSARFVAYLGQMAAAVVKRFKCSLIPIHAKQ